MFICPVCRLTCAADPENKKFRCRSRLPPGNVLPPWTASAKKNGEPVIQVLHVFTDY